MKENRGIAQTFQQKINNKEHNKARKGKKKRGMNIEYTVEAHRTRIRSDKDKLRTRKIGGLSFRKNARQYSEN